MTDYAIEALKKIASDPTNAKEVAETALVKMNEGSLANLYYLSVYEYPNMLHYERFRTSDKDEARNKYNEIKEKFKSNDPKTAGGGHGRWAQLYSDFANVNQKEKI